MILRVTAPRNHRYLPNIASSIRKMSQNERGKMYLLSTWARMPVSSRFPRWGPLAGWEVITPKNRPRSSDQ